MESLNDAVFDARPLNVQLREACSAVLTGAISGGFDGPQGLSITEAMDYACKLAVWATRVLESDLLDKTTESFFLRDSEAIWLTSTSESDNV